MSTKLPLIVNTMLKHHPKLKRLHDKAKWKGKGAIQTLDMRNKNSKEFMKEIGDEIQKQAGDKTIVNRLATKK